ncbi:MAG: hypothetical protein ACYC91_09215 [Solirubrobacteraceae bacterium]
MYLMGDILTDAGTRHAAGRILRQLREGDELAGFRVLDTPGRSAGTYPSGGSLTAR